MKKETLSEMIGYTDEKLLVESEHPRHISMTVSASLGAVACAVLIFGAVMLFRQGGTEEMVGHEGATTTQATVTTQDTTTTENTNVLYGTTFVQGTANTKSTTTTTVSTKAESKTTAASEQQTENTSTENLPHLELSSPTFNMDSIDDFAFYAAESLDLFYKDEPNFTNLASSTLPVYQYAEQKWSVDQMETRAREIAANMGEEIQQIKYWYNTPQDGSVETETRMNGECTSVNAYLNGMYIYVLDSGYIGLSMTADENSELRKVPVTTNPDGSVTDEQEQAVFNAAIDKYKGFFGSYDPHCIWYPIYLDADKSRGQIYEAYCDSVDPQEALLYYSQGFVSVDMSSLGTIDRLNYPSSLPIQSTIGNYPLISAEEAAATLKNETPVWTNLKYITYDTEEGRKWIPCYRFTVETGNIADGKKEYCHRFVPAISPEYYDLTK
ncbi:MAG: hypothetical protein MJ062_00370 [Oscillospiraceae bacterium]|nr:hypothetical protein [Oscillospiraceae bacterium]